MSILTVTENCQSSPPKKHFSMRIFPYVFNIWHHYLPKKPKMSRPQPNFWKAVLIWNMAKSWFFVFQSTWTFGHPCAGIRLIQENSSCMQNDFCYGEHRNNSSKNNHVQRSYVYFKKATKIPDLLSFSVVESNTWWTTLKFSGWKEYVQTVQIRE